LLEETSGGIKPLDSNTGPWFVRGNKWRD
jgi:hypothetical protein